MQMTDYQNTQVGLQQIQNMNAGVPSGGIMGQLDQLAKNFTIDGSVDINPGVVMGNANPGGSFDFSSAFGKYANDNGAVDDFMKSMNQGSDLINGMLDSMSMDASKLTSGDTMGINSIVANYQKMLNGGAASDPMKMMQMGGQSQPMVMPGTDNMASAFSSAQMQLAQRPQGQALPTQADPFAGFGAAQGRLGDIAQHGAMPTQADPMAGFGAAQGRLGDIAQHGAMPTQADPAAGFDAAQSRLGDIAQHGARPTQADPAAGFGAAQSRLGDIAQHGARPTQINPASGFDVAQLQLSNIPNPQVYPGSDTSATFSSAQMRLVDAQNQPQSIAVNPGLAPAPAPANGQPVPQVINNDSFAAAFASSRAINENNFGFMRASMAQIGVNDAEFNNIMNYYGNNSTSK